MNEIQVALLAYVRPSTILMTMGAKKKIAFLGYDLAGTTVEPGGTLHPTVYWQVLAEMEASHRVFAKLLDAENRTWGHKDDFPAKGTSRLKA